MIKLTIHTATYNRAYILSNAYNSLKDQTCKDFEWIITDDGSTDYTEQLVSYWKKEDCGFPIIYNKLNHVGIPRALNSGIALANSEWFLMLDSDDKFLPKTVEKVLEWIDEIKDDTSFAGIGFAKCFPNGEFMKKQIPKIHKSIGYVDATHIERSKYNLNMDMSEAHRTSLFKKYPFQYWIDEEFAPEQLNYYQIALDGYKLRWRAEKLCICDYLPDGMTKDNSLVKNNPMGFAMMYNQLLLISPTLKEKFKNTIQMTALAFYAGHPNYIFTSSNNKLLSIITLPIGIALSMRRRIQFNKLQ